MNTILNALITWTGWIAAIGVGIWEIVKVCRNRIAIKLDVILLSNSGQWVYITITNVGRRPVNFIRAGFQYSNGDSEDFPATWNIAPGWVYKTQPRGTGLSINAIKQLVKSRSEKMESVYFIDEQGRPYETKIPDSVKQLVYK